MSWTCKWQVQNCIDKSLLFHNKIVLIKLKNAQEETVHFHMNCVNLKLFMPKHLFVRY
jgi:hypothetical protein